MNVYSIKEALDKADINDFIKVPFNIYRGDKYWVPQLISESRKIFDRNINPFFLHSQARFFVAYQNKKPIARIAGIINNRHNQTHNEKIGFFGFFECPNDSGLAKELFDSAASYLKAAGLTAMRGPANYSSNDDWGFLAEGFDRSPVFQMPYNPPYYLELAENYGFTKCKDLLAYWIDNTIPLPEKAIKIAETIRKKENILVRRVDLKQIERELRYVRQIYNAAWSKNWGFVPLTEEELMHTANDLRKILDPNLVFLAFVHDEPAGMSLSMPDYNIVFKKMKGRLYPFGVFKFLWHTKIAHSIKGARIMAMGIVPKFQKLGLDTIFYLDTYRNGIAGGYYWGEMSWILEDNLMMNRAARMMGAKPYKRYRLYEKPL
ncbi:MAG: N-acetyltransferase [candidate division Zixibacteria bacterium]|nr:N-acetyltransferase [candidate division Zixibacteria bacterium]